GSNTAYLPWREICRTLFGVDAALSASEQVEQLTAALAAIEPSLVERAPLLDSLLELQIPATDLTRGLDAKRRKSSLESLVVDGVRARAGREPVLIVLEDAHWLDDLSQDLLEAVARTVASLPVVLLVTYRPEHESPLSRLPLQRELELDQL